MATLRDFFEGDEVKLQDFVLKHNISEFVETGTGMGDTVEFVRRSIMKIWSIEIIPEIANKAKERFKDDNSVNILNFDSFSGLLVTVTRRDTNFLYFLDAHFPGADFGLAKYEDCKDKDIRIPLQKEITAIIKRRGDQIKRDVFIIDDLRIYEDGPFEDGNWPLRKKLGGNGIDFIYDAFSETHYIEKDYRWQGFLVITPMK
jgi:hypothetical protein